MDTTKTKPSGQSRRPQQQTQEAPRKKRAPQEVQEAPRKKRPPQEAQEAPRKKRPQQETQKAPRKKRPQQETQEAPRKKRPPQEAQETPRKKRPAAEEKKKTMRSGGTAGSGRRTAVEDPEDVPNKKRAYGKSKPPRRSVFETLGMAAQETVRENARRKKVREARKGKKRPSTPTPAIIYTQPKVFNRTRLAMQLVTVLAVVLALVLGMNVFFRVGDIKVTGADVYTPNSVIEASGIKVTREETETEKAQKGDGLFTFSRTRAGALIIKNLPYVKNVSFGIKLPDTVNIIIEEEDVVYSLQDAHDAWWLINSEGRVIESIKDTAASNYTKVLGIRLLNPANGQRAVAVEKSDMPDNAPPLETVDPTDPTETTEEVFMGSTAAQRLTVALEILAALEDNDIVGSAASVDVSQLENITLWYGSRYQVQLGDSNRLHEKIDYMNDVIAQMSDYQSGILDISFRIWTNQVGYTPFS